MMCESVQRCSLSFPLQSQRVIKVIKALPLRYQCLNNRQKTISGPYTCFNLVNSNQHCASIRPLWKNQLS